MAISDIVVGWIIETSLFSYVQSIYFDGCT
jgi:hypothetical protein